MKIKVTVPVNGCPLTSICNSLSETYDNIKSATKMYNIGDMDFDLLICTLDGMRSGVQDVIEFHNGIRMEALSKEGEQR